MPVWGQHVPEQLTLPALKLKNGGKKFLKLTADQVRQALILRHPRGGEWVLLFEMAFATGFEKGFDNHIDAMAFNCWPSSGQHRTAYEIKVSREDFKKELKNPKKRENAVRFSHFFYFVAPKGLIDIGDLPSEAGLVEIDEDLTSRIVRKAPFRDSAEINTGFFLTALRNAQGITLNRQFQAREFLTNMLEALHGWDENLFEEQESEGDSAWIKGHSEKET